MNQFYIISTKHTSKNAECITLWGPNSCGYQINLNYAGKYSRAEIIKISSYHYKGKDNEDYFFIPVESANRYSVEVAGEKDARVLPNIKANLDALREMSKSILNEIILGYDLQ